MKKTLILLSIVLISAGSLYAAGSEAGTSTAVFLKMEQGARALGMGGAYVAMDKDIESVWWNPAGLVFMDGAQLNFSYSDYISDLSGSYAAFAKPIGKNGNSALIGDVNYISMGSIDGRDAAGAVTKSLSLYNVVAGLGYAFPTARNISFGIHAKYLQQNLGDYSAAGVVADLGMLYKLSDKLSLGVSVQNIGQKIKTSTFENQLPMTTRAGLAYSVSPKLLLALDGEMPNDANNRIHIGSEYRMTESFFLRAGYNTNEAVGFCAGVGVLTPITLSQNESNAAWWKEAVDKDWKHNVVRIDYAYISGSGNLEITHRISATLKF